MLKHLCVPALLVAAALAACTPDSTGPDGLITTGGPALDLSDPPVVVDVLQRSEPLLHSLAASGVIGRGGGTLRIPEAGFSITFPSNAVRVPTLVTVTAVPGTAVAYLFAPHGLVFHRSPAITQDLRGTEVFGHPSRLGELEGAYFPDPGALEGLTATIRETRPTTVDVSGWRMRFDVDHFSGYTASTRRTGYISSSGNLIPLGR